MIDFTKLRLKPIELWDLNKDQAHIVLFAKPNMLNLLRPVIWYSTELVFSESLGLWEPRYDDYHSYYYSSSGLREKCAAPDEDWEELQLFSPHEHLA